MEQSLELLTAKIVPGSRLLRSWPLVGGVSATVTAVELTLSEGALLKLVIRCHGEADRKRNPNIAADEYNLLHILYSAGLPVPRPYYAGFCTSFPAPCLVIEYIEGKAEFAPTNLPAYLRQMASALARIHSLDVELLNLSFLPRQSEVLPASGRLSLVHGDYWPGNILWQEQKLAAIIDWEDACVGSPLYDLANCRLELLWAFDQHVMQAFTSEYQALSGLDLSLLSCWDIHVASKSLPKVKGWGLPPAREQEMEVKGHWFIDYARRKCKF